MANNPKTNPEKKLLSCNFHVKLFQLTRPFKLYAIKSTFKLHLDIDLVHLTSSDKLKVLCFENDDLLPSDK